MRPFALRTDRQVRTLTDRVRATRNIRNPARSGISAVTPAVNGKLAFVAFVACG